MDRTMLMIVALVCVVAAVGWFTVADQRQDITGNVVQGCGSCSGTPVCAGKEGKARNYESSCAAACDGARVLYGEICEQIPRG